MTRELDRWGERGSEEAPEPYPSAKQAYSGMGPDEEQLARMLGRVESAVAREQGKEDNAAESPAAQTKAGARFALKLLAMLGLGLGLGMFFVLGPKGSDGHSANPIRVPAAPVLEPNVGPATLPEPQVPLQQAAEPVASDAQQAPLEHGARKPRRTKVDDPADELAILSRARRIMLADPARALAITEEHRSAHRDGVLAEERELLAIEALLALERKAEADARARRFMRKYPSSVHGSRLGVMLQRPAL